ncbi:MAG: DUF3619 family protein [Steroidobacteraceae bacterium]
MSRDQSGTADFERRLQALLEESVQRVGGRARSRLNQARHAALAQAGQPRQWRVPRRLAAGLGRRLSWMPAVGAIAGAVLVAFVLWPHTPHGYPAVDASHASAEDLELLADHDGMGLMQNGDGQFYEWAMAQADKGGQPAGPAAGEGKSQGGQTGDAATDQNNG